MYWCNTCGNHCASDNELCLIYAYNEAGYEVRPFAYRVCQTCAKKHNEAMIKRRANPDPMDQRSAYGTVTFSASGGANGTYRYGR